MKSGSRLERFLYCGLSTENTDFETLSRLAFLNVILVFGPAISFFSSFVFYFRGERYMAAYSMFGAAIGWGILTYLHRTRNVTRSGSLLLLLLIYILTSYLINGGIAGEGVLFLFLFPLVAFHLKGKQQGIFWSLLYAGVLLGMAGLLRSGLVSGPYSMTMIANSMAVYLLYVSLTFFYESRKERIEGLLKEKQIVLTDLNRTLEDRVAEKTLQLQQANESLEHQVQDEVRKNRQKDLLMIQQSRLAAMGEMVGNIAHQWRQPLNALGLVLYKLQKSYEKGLLDEELMDRSMEKGQSLIHRMSTTIDDFRNFFRPNKVKREFALDDVIKEVAGLIEASLENHNIRLTVTGAEGITLLGFPGEYSQVLLNLIGNARDAIMENKEHGGTIVIETSIENDMALLRVKDSGGGIPEAVFPRIFDPYFTTREQGKGTGVGLYMSKMMIEESMKGRLVAENSSEGAIFTIMISMNQTGAIG